MRIYAKCTPTHKTKTNNKPPHAKKTNNKQTIELAITIMRKRVERIIETKGK
jgi:hypothetical protein